jgi:hypothetical protein
MIVGVFVVVVDFCGLGSLHKQHRTKTISWERKEVKGSTCYWDSHQIHIILLNSHSLPGLQMNESIK